MIPEQRYRVIGMIGTVSNIDEKSTAKKHRGWYYLAAY